MVLRCGLTSLCGSDVSPSFDLAFTFHEFAPTILGCCVEVVA